MYHFKATCRELNAVLPIACLGLSTPLDGASGITPFTDMRLDG